MSSNNTQIDFSDKFALASPKKQTLYPINQRDWLRLKKMIQNTVPQTNWCQIVLSISIGIFATSSFALLGFHSSKEIKNWVIIPAWMTLAASLVLVIACFIFDRKKKQNSVFAKEQIMEEVKIIESSFEDIENQK